MCSWLQCADSIGVMMGPVKKMTRARTTKLLMAKALSKKCACRREHEQLDGRLTSKAGSYPWKLAKVIVKINVPDVEDVRTVEDVTGDTDHIKYSELHTDLLQDHSVAEVKWIAKTHEQLAHPWCRALALALQEMKCDERAVALARKYSCEACLHDDGRGERV